MLAGTTLFYIISIKNKYKYIRVIYNNSFFLDFLAINCLIMSLKSKNLTTLLCTSICSINSIIYCQQNNPWFEVQNIAINDQPPDSVNE